MEEKLAMGKEKFPETLNEKSPLWRVKIQIFSGGSKTKLKAMKRRFLGTLIFLASTYQKNLEKMHVMKG